LPAASVTVPITFSILGCSVTSRVVVPVANDSNSNVRGRKRPLGSVNSSW
jgi:hypothetical protein